MNLTWELCHSVSFVTTIVASFFIIVGMFGSHISSKQIKNKEKALQEQIDKSHKNEIDMIKNYTRMSYLDYRGLSTGGGAGGLVQATEISSFLEKAVQVDKDEYLMKTDAKSEAIYKKVIELYPHFPFAYYCLANSQKKRNDAMWKSNAKKALEILEKTTKIDGHFRHHDQAKEEILKWEKDN